MSKNFSTYYPGFDRPTPKKYKLVMDEFYTKKFPDIYQKETGLIIHTGSACALKNNISEINSENLNESRIAFFQVCNPVWANGDELTCIAKMTFLCH